jgi:hypothetical protein
VDGDPLADIGALRRVSAVILRGARPTWANEAPVRPDREVAGNHTWLLSADRGPEQIRHALQERRSETVDDPMSRS